MTDGPHVAPRKLVLYDDRVARRFEPFALARPIATLVAGTTETWARWATALQMDVIGVVAAPHLADFDEPPRVLSDVIRRGTVVANSRFSPTRAPADRGPVVATGQNDSGPDYWRADGRIAAVRLREDLEVDALSDGSFALDALVTTADRSIDITGWWQDAVWDYLRSLTAVLTDDIERLATAEDATGGAAPEGAISRNVTVLGAHRIVVRGGFPGETHDQAALVEPHVVLDATAGPIYLAPGARIRAFSRLNGPCYVGPHSIVAGGEISNCSIGPWCKVRGEMSSTIVHGFANKGHEGFVGHSYIGQWVNLGAGTTTSNLKNTYGHVSLWTPDGVRSTGMQFLGTLFGDHAKTGIGTLLSTGTVVGAGANVFGGRMPPRVVPPFAWGEGEPYREYGLDKFLEAAERMMGRRSVVLTDRMRRQLAASHRLRWAPNPGR